MNTFVEICSPSVEWARKAASLGANRIELCEDLSCGGITPPHPNILSLTKGVDALKIPVNVLIRPRSEDFVYSEMEALQMMDDIRFCGSAGANGVVLGALKVDGSVDIELCSRMITLARSYGLSVTFHRAIDETTDILAATKDVISLGVDRILTSGGATSAWEGRESLKAMLSIVGPSGPKIMAGAGITASNAGEIVSFCGVSEIHGSRLELCEFALR